MIVPAIRLPPTSPEVKLNSICVARCFDFTLFLRVMITDISDEASMR